MKRRKSQNYKFEDSLIVNDATYVDYLNRFRRIALSMFEWVNLPKSMDARYLEQCLYYNGQAFRNTISCFTGSIFEHGQRNVSITRTQHDDLSQIFGSACTNA